MLLLDPGPVTFAERVRPGSQGVDGRSSNGPRARPQYALHSGNACLLFAGGLATLGIDRDHALTPGVFGCFTDVRIARGLDLDDG
jgi:hypothetical protein